MFKLVRATNHLMHVNMTKQVVRHKRNIPRRRQLIDPGIQNRKTIVGDNNQIEELDDCEFDLEADFMKVGKTHKQHEEEQALKLEQQKYQIVGQKYFKQKLPNFLTWSDKEQIRYLNNTNPDEWTIEKLSEGFPALPDVISKIVKSAWSKDSENKIRKHDESVKKNWKMLKENTLKDLPPDLVDHLQKFTNRELNHKPFETPKGFKMNSTKSMVAPNIKVGTEFSDIISSYKKLKNKDNDNSNDGKEIPRNNKIEKISKNDTYVLNSNSKINKRHTTLSSLQQRIEKRHQEGKALAEEKIILNALKEEKEITNIQNNVQDITEISRALEKYPKSKNKVAVSKFNENQNSTLDYPDRINIPKDKYKPGYTYKLNDCYYDDDGEFLYRVPGMYK